jgi:hypothetical protein
MVPLPSARVCVERAIQQWSSNLVEVSAGKRCRIEIASIGEMLKHRVEDVYGDERMIV